MTSGRSLSSAPFRAVAALFVVLVVGSGPALAAPGTETPEDLRNELLAGQTAGDWNSTMRVVMDRGQVGDVLGPLFSDAEHAKRIDLLATVGAYLARHPTKDGRVLLAQKIFRRAAAPDGAAFLAKLEEPMEPDRQNGRRRPDWDRLQNAAAALLAQPTESVADREAALAFLVREQGSRLDWVLATLETEARRQAAVTAPTPEDARLTDALRAALTDLLAYEFESAAQAARLLEETRNLPYVARLKHFSHLKDAGAQDRAVAKKYLGAAIARADTPAALAQATADAARYPDLLADALQRAGDLKPEPNAEWSDFFATFFAAAGAPDLVLAALDRLAESGFGGRPGECCSTVADAIQARLATRRPADPPAVRVRLVETLGNLGWAGAVSRQVEVALRKGLPAAEEVPEWVALVIAVGTSPGAVAAQLKPFYTLPAEAPETREALRSAVAKALGREGMRKSDGAAAEAALTSMLAGTDGWDQAVLPKVRDAALRSLGAYPGAGTAALLLGLAEATGADKEAEAQIALETLGTMTSAGAGRHHGAAALVSFLQRTRERTDVEPRRVEAVRLLKHARSGTAAEALSAEVRENVAAALRDALATGSEAVRTQAARTATELAEPSALPALSAWWAEQPAAPRSDLLRGLLDAVVRPPAPKEAPAAGAPDPDALVAEALRVVSKAQPAIAVEWAAALVRAGARPGPPRTLLLVAQGRAHADLAAAAEAGAAGQAQRRDELIAARTILTTAHDGARAPEDAEQTRRLLLDVLERLAAEVEGADAAKALLLEAVGLAGRSSNVPVVETGIRLAERLLNEEPLRASLTAQERADLDRQLETLRSKR